MIYHIFICMYLIIFSQVYVCLEVAKILRKSLCQFIGCVWNVICYLHWYNLITRGHIKLYFKYADYRNIFIHYIDGCAYCLLNVKFLEQNKKDYPFFASCIVMNFLINKNEDACLYRVAVNGFFSVKCSKIFVRMQFPRPCWIIT